MFPEKVHDAPRYVGVKGAAEILHVSASFLNKLRLTGNGPVFAKFGFHVRYSVPALLAWAESRSRTSTSDAKPPNERPPPQGAASVFRGRAGAASGS